MCPETISSGDYNHTKLEYRDKTMDENDGIRLDIGPFLGPDLPGGRIGAGFLCAQPNINWKEDRGKEPTRGNTQFPWFWKNGKLASERVDDVHLTNADKHSARQRMQGATNGGGR
jgi:hypothetical protein